MRRAIRVELPAHLRHLAGIGCEVQVMVEGAITLCTVIDALEADYPMLCGTVRDQSTKVRRPFIRFFVCETDLSQFSSDALLPEAVVLGMEPLLIVGAIAGGWASWLWLALP